jgi:hypothetical protein
MSRKDYIAIAAAIIRTDPPARQTMDDYERGYFDAVLVTARNIADVMQADNPRFDRALFLKACGVEA